MKVSGYLICIVAIIVAIWDGIAVSLWGVEASVSWWFAGTGSMRPTFALCIGILIGHFFAPMIQVIQGKKNDNA